MWRHVSRTRWLRVLLIASVCFIAACSAQRQTQQDGMSVNADDPFTDPFFTQPPAWDDSVLQQSEVLAEQSEEPEQPKTLLEKGEGFIFSTLIVGASVAKMALLPFIGF